MERYYGICCCGGIRLTLEFDIQKLDSLSATKDQRLRSQTKLLQELEQEIVDREEEEYYSLIRFRKEQIREFRRIREEEEE